ncbi:MAG: SDR family oxidoreductase, partial [Lactococcus sp.]|nr:SDR family oxidoreductase [Lactococcus sp.]
DYELTDGAFDKIFSINVKGAYIVAQGVARIMAVKGKGVIVNMSSEAGLEGSEGQSPYAASKAAINGFTRSWSKELARHQIRVIGVSPGIMEETGLRTLAYESSLAYTRGKTVEELRAGYSNTSATPLGRSGKLSEVADLVAYYLSDRASYITGITTNVAGGKSRG